MCIILIAGGLINLTNLVACQDTNPEDFKGYSFTVRSECFLNRNGEGYRVKFEVTTKDIIAAIKDQCK